MALKDCLKISEFKPKSNIEQIQEFLDSGKQPEKLPPKLKTIYSTSLTRKWKSLPKVEALTLPNGQNLQFRKKMGSEDEGWKETKDGKSYFAKSSIQDTGIPLFTDYKKYELPLFLFHKNTEMRVVAADFDELPSEFSNWSDFRAVLKQTFPEPDFLVTTTPSGKAKVFHLTSNFAQPRALFESTLDPTWKMDKLSATADQCFMTGEMVLEMERWLKNGPRVLGNVSEVKGVSNVVTLDHKREYLYKNIFDGVECSYAGDVILRRSRSNKDMHRKVTMTILSLFTSRKEFGISQKVLAKSCGVSVAYVNNVIKGLVAQGFLVVTDEYYNYSGKNVMGEECEKKAITYALGKGARFLLRRLLKKMKQRKSKGLFLKDGNRYKFNVWWSYQNCHKSDDEIKKLMDKIPGINGSGSNGMDRREELWGFIRYAKCRMAA